jgi:uncharacterized protein YegL
MPHKRDKKKPQDKRPEQGALGELLARSAARTPITDSREVLNPARPPSPADAPSPATSPTPVVIDPDTIAASALEPEPPAAPVGASAVEAARTVSVSPTHASIKAVGPAAPVDILGQIQGRGPARFKKLPGEASRRVMLIVALAVSVLVHAAIGVVMGKQTAGKLAAPLIDHSPDQQFRLLAPPPDDPIYSDPLLASDIPLAAPGRQPGLGELSRLLLLNKSEGTPTPPDATPVAAPRVAQADVQPDVPRVDLAAAPEVTELPADVNARLAGAAIELPVVTGMGTRPSAAPTTADAGPSAASQAKSLLKTGPLGSGFNFNPTPTPPTAAGPVVADAAPGVDRKLLESPSVATPLEITAISLAEAKTLELPEKLDDDFDYLVTKFRPEVGGGLFQNARPDKYTYFRVDISAKRSLRKLKTMPKDVVFLIDTSGSVPQEWVNGMTRGVSDALNTLNEGDRFNILFFAEKTNLFSADKIQPVSAATIAAAQKFLAGGKTGGDTDINRSLAQLLVRDTSAQRAYYLIFMSDGVPTRGVMDTRELINLVTRDNDLNASIYCVGVGSSQNKELLNFLAYRNKGFSTFANNSAQVAGNIRDLMSRVRYPIIKDVSLNAIGLDFEEVFPHNLPNIHQGETFSVYGRYEIGGAFTMRVSGHNGVKGMDVTFGGDLSGARVGEKTIPEDWAFWKLHHIYSEIIRQGEKPELKAKIAELKQRFDLKTLY